jgi:hypothetical protein
MVMVSSLFRAVSRGEIVDSRVGDSLEGWGGSCDARAYWVFGSAHGRDSDQRLVT